MPRLSVVLAVFNEEKNLEDCLRSVKDLAWEYVIVDGGSIDETVTIAKKFGARVIQTDNPVIFHINKQKAIDAARGDWILQLDADERVSPELLVEIKQKISEESDINGYFIPRLNFFLKGFLTKGGQYPDYTLRLYRRGSGHLPAKDVHEQAVVEGKVDYLKNNLIHMRDINFSKYLQGLNRYTDVMVYQMKESKAKINIYYFLSYLIFKPVNWFLKSYFRHRGYVDGFPGLIFALFSSLRFPIAYIKFWGSKV